MLRVGDRTAWRVRGRVRFSAPFGWISGRGWVAGKWRAEAHPTACYSRLTQAQYTRAGELTVGTNLSIGKAF
jgi:hypothetical protein